MAVCPNCKYEYVPGITICPDCNTPLVDASELKNILSFQKMIGCLFILHSILLKLIC